MRVSAAQSTTIKRNSEAAPGFDPTTLWPQREVRGALPTALQTETGACATNAPYVLHTARAHPPPSSPLFARCAPLSHPPPPPLLARTPLEPLPRNGSGSRPIPNFGLAKPKGNVNAASFLSFSSRNAAMSATGNAAGNASVNELESTPWLLRLLLRVPSREDGRNF